MLFMSIHVLVSNELTFETVIMESLYRFPSTKVHRLNIYDS